MLNIISEISYQFFYQYIAIMMDRIEEGNININDFALWFLDLM
jgi:hypothetical protein